MMVLWSVFCFFSFGVLGLHFVLMRRAATKSWHLETDQNYLPMISLLVPSYNESEVIRFKLENLCKLEYPRHLTQIIVVDSNSEDRTVDIVNNFVKEHPENNIQILIESKRKGKSAALNMALGHCKGEIVLVSDADCFWPFDILLKAMPFLADPSVGAISGAKVLLNPDQSWVTKAEMAYLNSMNLTKLGESKAGSTIFFEGGFSAYKRQLLESFDPYDTGSDDCGTIISLIEKRFRAIFVPEARFYTTFPVTWKERTSMKMRRANQLIRVLWKYVGLISRKRITSSRRIIVRSIMNYMLAPVMFIALMVTTIFLLWAFPYFALIFLLLLIPKVRFYLIEVVQNYIYLSLSFIQIAIRRKFVVWNKPKDRVLLTEKMLRDRGLI